jgi:hypothetical protein
MNSLNALLSHSKYIKQGDFAALLTAAAAEIAPTLVFPTKADYLAWVSEWKTAYRYLSFRSRVEKIDSRGARLPEKVARLEIEKKSLTARLEIFGGVPPLLGQTYTIIGGSTSRHVSTSKQAARYLLALRKAGKLTVGLNAKA